MADALVPFGKYKGQPVEVLAQDQAYCDWLVGQDWFRTKFVGIHTLIVNHFGETVETPEHNALQARFLDGAWCQRVALCVGCEANRIREIAYVQRGVVSQRTQLLTRRDTVRTHRDESLARLARGGEDHLSDYLSNSVRRQDTELAELDEKVHRLDDVLVRLRETQWQFRPRVEFEVEGVDVTLIAELLSVTRVFAQDDYAPLIRQAHRIECKPVVGDDYPAVLRQMKASKATVLLAGAVQSAVISLEQIRRIFGASDITVLTVAEVEQHPLLWGLWEIP